MATNRFISTESLFEFKNVTDMLDCYTHLIQNNKGEEAYEVMSEIKSVIMHLVIEKYMNQGELEKSDYLNTAFTTELLRRHDLDTPPVSPILFEDEHKHGLVIHAEEKGSVKVTVEKDEDESIHSNDVDDIDNESIVEEEDKPESVQVIVEKAIITSKQSAETTKIAIETLKTHAEQARMADEDLKTHQVHTAEQSKKTHVVVEEVEEEEAEEEAEEEEEEVEEEEEEVEEEGIELEDFMIGKKKYFIDRSTNNIYQCLEDDEVGDIVGKIENGKFVRI